MSRSERPSEVKVHVGQRLQAIRAFLDLSQEKLADSIGARQNTYCNWEKGSRLADPLAMIRLCDRYGCTMDYIYRNILAGMPLDQADSVQRYFPREIPPKKPRKRA